MSYLEHGPGINCRWPCDSCDGFGATGFQRVILRKKASHTGWKPVPPK